MPALNAELSRLHSKVTTKAAGLIDLPALLIAGAGESNVKVALVSLVFFEGPVITTVSGTAAFTVQL